MIRREFVFGLGALPCMTEIPQDASQEKVTKTNIFDRRKLVKKIEESGDLQVLEKAIRQGQELRYCSVDIVQLFDEMVIIFAVRVRYYANTPSMRVFECIVDSEEKWHLVYGLILGTCTMRNKDIEWVDSNVMVA